MNQIFDRAALRTKRDRIAGKIAGYNFLCNLVAKDLYERINDFNQDFPVCLLMDGVSNYDHPITGNKITIYSDISFNLLRLKTGYKVVINEELIPFPSNSFDLIISVLNLHYVNDLEGCLDQIKKSLRPNGVFVAAIFGGNSLIELQRSMLELEIENNLAVVPHIIPFIDANTMANLIQKIGFSNPVVDAQQIIVTYNNVIDLLHDLRYMGEDNCIIKKNKNYLGKTYFDQLNKKYKEKFSYNNNEIKTTFEIITMFGSKL